MSDFNSAGGFARSVTTFGRSPDTSTTAEIGDAAADAGVDLAVAGAGAGEVGDAAVSSSAAIARNNLRRSPSQDPDFLQVLIRELAQDVGGDCVLTERRLVAFETETTQPYS